MSRGSETQRNLNQRAPAATESVPRDKAPTFFLLDCVRPRVVHLLATLISRRTAFKKSRILPFEFALNRAWAKISVEQRGVGYDSDVLGAKEGPEDEGCAGDG